MKNIVPVVRCTAVNKILVYEHEQGRNEKFQNELREECIKKCWEPLD